MADTQAPAQGRIAETNAQRPGAMPAGLGYSETDIAQLTAAGVIAVEPARRTRKA